MTKESPSIEFAPPPETAFKAWLQTPPGQALLAWEQAQLDAAVADLFGFHALQLGLPGLAGLRSNRMPHRWAAGVDLHCDFDALPFESGSLDLVLLPHSLELSGDPHAMLREVERVLRPEGRLLIVGLNPASSWGLRQKLGHSYLPSKGEFIGYWRLRDWLRLLSFEVELGRFGVYAPPVRSQAWLARWHWIEAVGARWWPVLGAVYFIQAVKRVHGMRLIGLARQGRRKTQAAPAVVAQHQQHKGSND